MISSNHIPFNKLVLFAGIWGLYIGIGSAILYLVAVTEPSTYMDEIFHVGQGEQYCAGNFHQYDPKLTTPPGLYIVTVALLSPLSKLFSIDLCTVNAFRVFNYFVSLLNSILLYLIVNSRILNVSSLKKLLISLCLSSLPVLYFFSFFYYTDTMSTFLVLLTLHLYRKNRSFSAGLAGEQFELEY